jgi:hypothetical protein
MSKQQTKKVQARIEVLAAVAQISKANAKRAKQAKFRKLADAKAKRIAARIARLKAKLAA